MICKFCKNNTGDYETCLNNKCPTNRRDSEA